MCRLFFVTSPFSNDFFPFPLSSSCGCRKRQGAEGCWNLCSHPWKGLCCTKFLAVSFSHRHQWHLWGAQGADGWEPELWAQPQSEIQKPWVRLCCCRDLCHPSATWVCAMAVCPVRSPWMAPASSFQSIPPVLAKFCPEKLRGSLLWIAQFSQNLSQAAPSKVGGILVDAHGCGLAVVWLMVFAPCSTHRKFR